MEDYYETTRRVPFELGDIRGICHGICSCGMHGADSGNSIASAYFRSRVFTHTSGC